MGSDSGQLHSKKKRRTFGKVMEDLMHNTNVTDGAVRLYGHMHWRYGQNKRNFEGQSSMAEMLGVTEKTVSERIKELEALDWVIVVERDFNQKTGKFQTPFYHVFESQRECRVWRKNYTVTDGESLRAKGVGRTRKSRKGAGNPRPNRQNSSSDGENHHRQNSSSDVHQNSSSDGDAENHQNSSSDYLDSVSYLDSIHPDSSSSPGGDSADFEAVDVNTTINEISVPKQETVKSEADQLFDLIQQAWTLPPSAAGRVGQFRKFLTGKYLPTGDKAKDRRDAQWIQHNIQPGMTLAEIAGFVAWYVDRGDANLPESPEKLATWVFRFRQDEERFMYLPSENDALPDTDVASDADFDAIDYSAELENVFAELEAKVTHDYKL